MLMIRLARFGARKQPYYRVVVIEKDRARNGRSIEVVGTYNPRTSPATLDLKRDRIEHWTSKGAQLSDRVAKLLKIAPAAPVAAFPRTSTGWRQQFPKNNIWVTRCCIYSAYWYYCACLRRWLFVGGER